MVNVSSFIKTIKNINEYLTVKYSILIGGNLIE